jgi:hypothetical protein
MAAPVEFRAFTPEDSRLDLQRRIASAPRERAEAVLESYELLQRLHDCGALAIANGLLSAGPTVIAKLTDVVSSAPAITSLRIGLALGKIATDIDPNRVEQVVADSTTDPSWWRIVRLALRKETRQALGLSLGLLAAFGAAIGKQHQNGSSK